MFFDLTSQDLFVWILRLFQRFNEVSNFVEGYGDTFPGGSTQGVLIFIHFGRVVPVFPFTDIVLVVGAVSGGVGGDTSALCGSRCSSGLLRSLFRGRGRCWRLGETV